MTLGKIFKYAIFVGLIFVLYKGMKHYAIYRLGSTLINDCGASEKSISDLKNNNSSDEEVRKYMQTAFTCVRDHQNAFEKLLAPVPDAWLNPPSGSITKEQLRKAFPN